MLGQIFSLAVEPLLVLIWKKVNGVNVQGTPCVSVSAYADDVSVFVSNRVDVQELEDCLQTYNLICHGVKVEPCFVDPGAALCLHSCPGVCCGAKQVSKLAALNAPAGLLTEIQRRLVAFFWSGQHWLKAAVLYLPTLEGGQGLIEKHGKHGWRLADDGGWQKNRGTLLTFSSPSLRLFEDADGKALYAVCAKVRNLRNLTEVIDHCCYDLLRGQSMAGFRWRVLYKLPVPKRSGDLQWRIRHRAIATNQHTAHFVQGVDMTCPFCSKPETVAQLFAECSRLNILFGALNRLCINLNMTFTYGLFILGPSKPDAVY
ncbi:hypothetical protein AOLI_G00236790 [Acnodon oligacanthus]